MLCEQKAVASLLAHDHPLVALAFNCAGKLLATASDMGTVIRVFAIPEGTKIAEFSRGLTRYCSFLTLLALDSFPLHIPALSPGNPSLAPSCLVTSRPHLVDCGCHKMILCCSL